MLASMNGSTGQIVGPTLEEAEAQVAKCLERLDVAKKAYDWTREQFQMGSQGLELSAHRAQVLATIVGDLMGAAYNLQRAAYAKATT